MKCRFCKSELNLPFIDLGSAPPSNAYLTVEALHAPEKWYPLRVLVCTKCWLVQTEDFALASELFSSDYAYFSSYSSTWLEHAKRYVDKMTKRFALTSTSHIVEIAANDGYLLQFANSSGIPCTGVEPTASTAAAARAKGIPIIEDFFGVSLAMQMAETGKQADLLVANNVLAHVPDVNDFVSGFTILLKPEGIATFEFPHLLNLVKNSQFDTIYHEHYSYLSLTAVKSIFTTNGLNVFDIEELSTHGGSLRVFAQRKDTGKQQVSPRVAEMEEREINIGMMTTDYYSEFQEKANKIKYNLISFLIEMKQQGKKVAAYGAAAKGNTLLNYAGIRSDLIPWVVDKNPLKQNHFLPGCRIPIVNETRVTEEKPDILVILPWNIREEIMFQLAYIKEWGGRFIVVVPSMEMI